jgi:antirestriction protein ArdC
MNAFYAEVSAQIIAELKTGVPPWVLPWRQLGRTVARNALTGRRYNGINILFLWMAQQRYRWPFAHFLSFKQALELGGHVRKGEHGIKIIFYKDLVVIAPEDAETESRRVPMLKTFTVFNIAQCEGLPDRIARPMIEAQHFGERDLLIEEFIATIGSQIREGADVAGYSLDRDFITMPPFRAFASPAEYYSTLFHEVGHWTGHPARFNRPLPGKWQEKPYALEELIAEFGAAFLCAEFAIDCVMPSASYIQSWISLFEDDPKALFTAASKASKAVDYLRDLILAAPVVQAAE